MKNIFIFLFLLLFVNTEAYSDVDDDRKARLRAKSRIDSKKLNEKGVLFGVHTGITIEPVGEFIAIDYGVQFSLYQRMRTSILFDFSFAPMMQDSQEIYSSGITAGMHFLLRVWLSHENYNEGFHMYLEPGIGLTILSASTSSDRVKDEKTGGGLSFKAFGLGIGYGWFTFHISGTYVMHQDFQFFTPNIGCVFMFKL